MKILQTFVAKGCTNTKSALVQLMDWCQWSQSLLQHMASLGHDGLIYVSFCLNELKQEQNQH